MLLCWLVVAVDGCLSHCGFWLLLVAVTGVGLGETWLLAPETVDGIIYRKPSMFGG